MEIICDGDWNFCVISLAYMIENRFGKTQRMTEWTWSYYFKWGLSNSKFIWGIMARIFLGLKCGCDMISYVKLLYGFLSFVWLYYDECLKGNRVIRWDVVIQS